MLRVVCHWSGRRRILERPEAQHLQKATHHNFIREILLAVQKTTTLDPALAERCIRWVMDRCSLPQMHGRYLSEDVFYAASQCQRVGLVAAAQSGRSVEKSKVSIWRFVAQAEIAAKAQCVRVKRLCSAMDTSRDGWKGRTSRDSMATL